MQCPDCFGHGKVDNPFTKRGHRRIKETCYTCGGTGVLYTQADVDELKHEIKIKYSMAIELSERLVNSEVPCPCGDALFSHSDCWLEWAEEEAKDSVELETKLWARKQVEEESGR